MLLLPVVLSSSSKVPQKKKWPVQAETQTNSQTGLVCFFFLETT